MAVDWHIDPDEMRNYVESLEARIEALESALDRQRDKFDSVIEALEAAGSRIEALEGE